MELNLAVVCGPVAGSPEVRALASGSSVASLSVRTAAGDRTTSVPVSIWDPPAWVVELDAGDEVIVLGGVRRRFFRTAAGTGSRVELEATFVGRPGKRQRDTVTRRIDATLATLRDR